MEAKKGRKDFSNGENKDMIRKVSTEAKNTRATKGKQSSPHK